jgi:DNA repair protein RadC
MQNILSKKEVLMHEHHRKRMKERFLREGIAYFEPHNVLELLLFYAIPQKDTNEIAHRLIERFGSLSAVFEAPFSELIQVEGIKEHSATLIKLIPELAGRYVSESYGTKGILLPTLDDAAEYLKSKYIGVTKEIVYLLLLDNKYKLLDCVCIYEGCVNSSHIPMRKLVEAAISANASYAVLSHNHPGGLPIPSSDDLFTTREAERAFTLIGVNFLGHILVAGDKYVDLLRP